VEKQFLIRPAQPADADELMRLIRALADYEKLSDMCIGTPKMLREALFGARRSCEALIRLMAGRPAKRRNAASPERRARKPAGGSTGLAVIRPLHVA